MTFALVLVSAFLHAAWNALIKREPNKDHALIAAAGIGALFGLAVAIVRGVSSGVAPFPTHLSLEWSLLAGAFEQAYFFTLARALDKGPLGPVYTISRGGAVLLVYPLSVLLFAEPLTALSIAGSVIVLTGLVVPEWLGRHGAVPLPRRATLWAVLCACCIAAYHLAYKAALQAGGASSAVFAVSMLFASLINFVRTDRPAVVAYVKRKSLIALSTGVLCGASFLMVIEALANGGTGFVLTLRNTSVLFAVLLARAIGEKPRLATTAGAILVALGAVVMSL